jgi:hypothetical protein
MEIPSFLSALCLPLASTAGYGPFVTSLTSWGAFTLINLICIYGLCESPSADGLIFVLLDALAFQPGQFEKQTLTT